MYSLNFLNNYSTTQIIYNSEEPISITFSNVPPANVLAYGNNSNNTMPITSVGTDITALSSADNVSYNIDLNPIAGATLTWVSPLPTITESSVAANVYTVGNIITVGDWETIRYPVINYPEPVNAINFGNNYSLTSNITYGNSSNSWTTTGIMQGPDHTYIKNRDLSLWYGVQEPVIAYDADGNYRVELTLGANIGYIAPSGSITPPANWNYANLTYTYVGLSTSCNSTLASLFIYPHTDVVTPSTLTYKQFRNGQPQVNNRVTLLAKEAEEPAAPTIGSAFGGNASATVSFVAGVDGGDPINYFTATSTPGGITATSTTSPITVTGLTNGITYTFKVTATNDIGVSADSAASNSVRVGAPAAPSVITTTSGDQQASIDFDPVEDYDSPITLYTVTRSPGNVVTSSATLPIVVTGLTNGQSYTFTANATNNWGTGPDSLASDPVVPAGVPFAPGNVVASGSGSSVLVSFSPAANNGSAVTLYTATSTPGGITATNTVSPVTVSGLTLGTAYTFKVKATNVVGTGAESTASNSVIAGEPDSPTLNRAYPASNTTAKVSFTAPTNQGADPISLYTVADAAGNIVATGTTSPITITGLTTGNSYAFKIKAANSYGESAYTALSPSFVVTDQVPIAYLVVGGGGEGGSGSSGLSGPGITGGGGSGGSVREGTGNLVLGTSYVVAAGAGGKSNLAGDSYLAGVAVYGYGGKRGSTLYQRGVDANDPGGHGSGAGGGGTYRGGYGETLGELIGYDGGGSSGRCGGGGGGAAGAGATGVGDLPGAGGNAYYSNITGVMTGYGGGGSGGVLYSGTGTDSYLYGYGGQGGGGNPVNTTWDGGDGGTGAVIIKYPVYLQANITVNSGTYSTQQVGDFNITTFAPAYAATDNASYTIKFE